MAWSFRAGSGASSADLGVAEQAVAALPPGTGRGGDELYLLVAADANVKVRDGLMDIKLLRESTPTAWSSGSR